MFGFIGLEKPLYDCLYIIIKVKKMSSFELKITFFTFFLDYAQFAFYNCVFNNKGDVLSKRS